MAAFEASSFHDLQAAADGRPSRRRTRTRDIASRFLCAVGVVTCLVGTGLVGTGCTTGPATSDPATSFKRNCTESVYLTGPTFPTCNNF